MHKSDTDGLQLRLYKSEETDLVDYDDSDIEINTGEQIESLHSVQLDDFQPDIFADDESQLEKTIQEPAPEEDKLNHSPDKPIMHLAATASSTAKTPQTAVLIKTLSKLLSDSTFRVSLGLAESGNAVDLSFWVSGLDFTLTLKIVGAAKVKACKHRAECHNANCTFDNSGVDRTVKSAAGKLNKLCSMINTVNGCKKGDACWFSHGEVGVTCSYGELRVTCPKGVYCFYKHKDDTVVPSVEAVDSSLVQAEKTVDVDDKDTATEDPLIFPSTPEIAIVEKVEAPAQAPASWKDVRWGSARTSLEIALPGLQEARRKGGRLGRESTEGTEDRPNKYQRIEKRHGRRDQHDVRGFRPREQGRAHYSSSRGRGRGHHRGSSRGRGRRGERGDSYRAPGPRQHHDREKGT